MELGKSDEAIKAFDKALEINSVDSVALAAKMHIWPLSH
jgi:predicted negative regulator of RcsB-dependent stress response